VPCPAGAKQAGFDVVLCSAHQALSLDEFSPVQGVVSFKTVISPGLKTA
jgi:hypothetical protein